MEQRFQSPPAQSARGDDAGLTNRAGAVIAGSKPFIRKKSLRDIDVTNKRVLVRADFNVPLSFGNIADDTRIRGALPTLQYLLDHKAAVIVCSHLGRPKGKTLEELRLDPIATRLSELLGITVKKVNDCTGAEVKDAARNLSQGEILLLENTRFHPEEERNAPELGEALAELAEVYVNDAFSTAHRAHASTDAVARHLPAVAGFLMEEELEILSSIRDQPEHPFVAVLGGAKISDKIDVIRALIERVDALLIGGGMGNTFLKAMGLEIGDSLVEEEGIDTARQIINQFSEKVILPVDVVVADEIKAGAGHFLVPSNSVPDGWRIVDIGPRTVELFTEKLREARTVIWNGPMGVFELEPFAYGTIAIARTMADLDARTVAGGGETVAATMRAGVADKLTHVSTGGGAFLAFMEGKHLPGLMALNDA